MTTQNRQGKTRLSKWYAPYDDDEKVHRGLWHAHALDTDVQVRLRGEVHRLIAPRDQKYQSNFVEVGCDLKGTIKVVRSAHGQFRSDKIVYRRYAGLFFCVCVDSNDNELAYLEAIHLFVEVLGESTTSLNHLPTSPEYSRPSLQAYEGPRS